MSTGTRATLDRRLSDALRESAGDAPMPGGLLAVPDAWVRGHRLARSWHRAAVAGGVVALASAVTLAVLSLVSDVTDRRPSVGAGDARPDVGVPIESLDAEPRRGDLPATGEPAIGPVWEVVSGRVRGGPFTYTVWRPAAWPDSICVSHEWGTTVDVGCGAMPGEGPAGEEFGMGSMTGGTSVVEGVWGLVSPDVAEVWVETDAGTRARARLVPLETVGFDAQLFVAYLPIGADSRAWVALDADGTVIDRLETPPGPADVPRPVPTPGAPPPRS